MARGILLVAILLGEFAALEAGLRVFGQAEAASAFQSLFIPDSRIGYRLRPGAAIRYSTAEFSTDVAINANGVRDDAIIGPKADGERRVLILGDSYVFAVQVPFRNTFGEQLESQLNASDNGSRWRVINGGVQGYGPVEEWLFYRNIAWEFQPDIVLIVVSVANDAIEAFDARAKLETGAVPVTTAAAQGRVTLRQIIRASAVLQLMRQRGDQLRARISASVAERPLATYLEQPPPFVLQGFETAAHAFGLIAESARNDGSRVAFILMPARFESHDEDFERVSKTVTSAGQSLRRHAAIDRFAEALRPLHAPTLNLLPVFAAVDDPRRLHFTRNTHLSALGHRVTADAIMQFLKSQGVLNREPS